MCAAVTIDRLHALQIENDVLARAQFRLEIAVQLLCRAEEQAALQFH